MLTPVRLHAQRGIPRMPTPRRGALVPEDGETIRRLFIRSISNSEWQVETVGRGKEALERLENRTYDLVFLNLFMPRMNGAEALAKHALHAGSGTSVTGGFSCMLRLQRVPGR